MEAIFCFIESFISSSDSHESSSFSLPSGDYVLYWFIIPISHISPRAPPESSIMNSSHPPCANMSFPHSTATVTAWIPTTYCGSNVLLHKIGSSFRLMCLLLVSFPLFRSFSQLDFIGSFQVIAFSLVLPALPTIQILDP